MREIVLDTETTGLDPSKGDRLIEIGCVELVNLIPTGQSFHRYINPERAVSEGAVAVHGLTDAFLADKPVFASVSAEFLDFIGDARLVIHNANFDKGFIDMELGKIGQPPLAPERIVDTLALARRKHPNGSNSLDALCARYGIDNSRRTKHGALLDAEILGEVYAELIGGRQAGLEFARSPARSAGRVPGRQSAALQRPKPLDVRLTEADLVAHTAFVAGLGARPIWRDYEDV
jgi:DNA polymerase-3 subunit epsilon